MAIFFFLSALLSFPALAETKTEFWPPAFHDVKALDFRQAQILFARDKSKDSITHTPKYDFPTQANWGALAYAPFKMLPVDLSRVDRLAAPITVIPSPDLQLFVDKNTVEPTLKVIERASRFIFIQMMAIDCDPTTELILQALEKKASQNVDVRVALHKGYSYFTLGCVNRLKKNGIQVLRAPIRSSLMVTDQNEMMIGSQSWARMFLLSDATNNLDRDVMVYIRDPMVTDAVKDYLATWKRYSGAPGKISDSEIESWIESHKSAGPSACRFVAQHPAIGQRDLESVLQKQMSAAQQEIVVTGVSIEPHFTDPEPELIRTMKDKSNAGVRVDYLGNGWDGGNGELTMVLDEWIKDSFFAGLLIRLRDWDHRRQSDKHFSHAQDLQQNSHITIWNYFHFLHYKIALFDQSSVLVSSANIDEKSLDKEDGSGIFCTDLRLVRAVRDLLLLDRMNSVPQ